MLHAHPREHAPSDHTDSDRRDQEDEHVSLNLRVDLVDDGRRYPATLRVAPRKSFKLALTRRS